MTGSVIVTLATTERYQRGQARLKKAFEGVAPTLTYKNEASVDAPLHSRVPYAFKAYALVMAADLGYTKLLWADACIVPNGTPCLNRIWEQVASQGVWMSRNGYTNHEWTNASAYRSLQVTPEENKRIEHVVATTFALDLNHPKGKKFLEEYYRLASETDAFCGPWVGGVGVQHRHDQTAASVIAYRLEISLTSPPDFFAYKGGETKDTVLIADGSYA